MPSPRPPLTPSRSPLTKPRPDALPPRQIFTEASAAIAAGRPPNSRACKYALNCLMNVFSSPGLPAGVGGGTLHRLVRVLLLRLVDEQLVRVAEGEALLKVRRPQRCLSGRGRTVPRRELCCPAAGAGLCAAAAGPSHCPRPNCCRLNRQSPTPPAKCRFQ